MFEIADEDGRKEFQEGAKIKVIGVGGGGCNAVNTMIKAGLSGVEYIVANTDSQALGANLAPTKVQLGIEITKGLGAGANPEVGRKAALDEYEKLSEVIEGADMVFITAGMGGGTGTGAAPVIAKLCKELGALTVGVVTKPFLFEGKKRFRQAEHGISTLEENVDSLITIPNQRLLYIAGESLSLVDTFKKADEVLLNAVRGISDLINTTGNINADFADVKTVMANKGLALMGTGVASGPDRAIKASTEAISSPLLEDISIDGSTGIIINITGNESLTMHETNEAVTLIMEAADEDAEIIFGTVIDNDMEENIKVTVVATGLGGLEKVKSSNVSHMINKKPEAVRQTTLKSHVEKRDEDRQNAWAAEPRSEVVEEKMITERAREIEVTTSSSAPAPQMRTEHNEIRTQESRREEVRWPQESRPESEENSQRLINSIKEAATKFKSDGANNAEAPGQWRNERPAAQSNIEKRSKSSTRAKSIAEKLGFINFDEEELDKPTFLRKDEETQELNRERPRPVDL